MARSNERRSDLRALKEGILAAAVRALAAYRSYQLPHTGHMENDLFSGVCGAVGELFKLMKTEPVLFFGPCLENLDALRAVGDAAREVHLSLETAVNESAFPDLNLPVFRGLFGDLMISAQWLRDEVDAGNEEGKATALMRALRQAIREKGLDAKPDAIIAAAKVNRQRGRNALRQLQELGDYNGFSRNRPRRFRGG